MRIFLVIAVFLLMQIQLLAQPLFQVLSKSEYEPMGCCSRINQLKSTLAEDESYDDWDLTYNVLRLTIDPAQQYIAGAVEFHFVALVENLEKIKFDLSSDLIIDSIVTNNTLLEFTRNNHKVSLQFYSPLMKDDAHNFEVFYRGVPNSTGFGSFVASFHADVPIVATLSQPYGAMDWWPCKQSLADKIDSVDVIVRSPEQYRTASNGVLILDDVSNGFRTNQWKHRHPIATYLVAIGVTNYSIYSEEAQLGSGEKVEILNYVYPENLEKAEQQTAVTASMIELFSDLFIDYPFANEKYGHAQFQWGGGMEHQTMSFMGNFNYELIAHELAHQWFGDFVTCNSWKHIWLNEGFATYLSALVYENLNSFYWPIWKTNVSKNVLSKPGGSVISKDTTNIEQIFNGRLSYRKGAFVLHMLRGQLGDEYFFKGIQSYLNDARVANGFANTDFLRENFEHVADTSLVEFFDNWIYGEGFPIYHYAWANTKNGVEVRISQIPSLLNGPFFKMKIPVQIYTDGFEETHWLMHVKNNQHFLIDTNAQIDSLTFDKELWLLGEKHDVSSSNAINSDQKITLFPNPASEQIFLESSENSSAEVFIYDEFGRLVLHESWYLGKSIDIRALPLSFYVLKFSGNHSDRVFHFLKK